MVQREVVEAGKAKGCADAFVVEENIQNHMITLTKASLKYTKGDEALIGLFRKGKYDAVATDDAKLARLLRISKIPFILPGLLIYHLLQDDIIDVKAALWALKQLAEFISEDEYSTVRLLMEKMT